MPAAPIDRYAGIRLTKADDGQVVFSLPMRPDLMQELGTVFGGVIALLAKSASGAAIQTTAPAGTGFTALDLKVNFLRPALAEGEELIATGSLTHRGKRLSIADAVVTYRAAGLRSPQELPPSRRLNDSGGKSRPYPPDFRRGIDGVFPGWRVRASL